MVKAQPAEGERATVYQPKTSPFALTRPVKLTRPKDCSAKKALTECGSVKTCERTWSVVNGVRVSSVKLTRTTASVWVVAAAGCAEAGLAPVPGPPEAWMSEGAATLSDPGAGVPRTATGVPLGSAGTPPLRLSRMTLPPAVASR